MNPYKAARYLRDAQILASGDPKRIGHRARNKVLAKGLGAVGFWKLWRGLWR